jgi:hypothetical protein
MILNLGAAKACLTTDEDGLREQSYDRISRTLMTMRGRHDKA